MSTDFFQMGRDIGRQMGAARERSTLEDALKLAAESNDPNVQQSVLATVLSRVSPERQGAAVQFIQNRMNQLQAQQAGDPRAAAFESLGLDPALSALSPQEVREVMKSQTQEREAEKARANTQNAFNRLAELAPLVGPTTRLGVKPETRKNRGEFQSLLGSLESHMVEMVSSGRLTDTRFNYIVNNLLPTVNDTEATIRGKLEGIGRMLNLEMPDFDSVQDESPGQQAQDRPPLDSFFGGI